MHFSFVQYYILLYFTILYMYYNILQIWNYI